MSSTVDYILYGKSLPVRAKGRKRPNRRRQNEALLGIVDEPRKYDQAKSRVVDGKLVESAPQEGLRDAHLDELERRGNDPQGFVHIPHPDDAVYELTDDIEHPLYESPDVGGGFRGYAKKPYEPTLPRPGTEGHKEAKARRERVRKLPADYRSDGQDGPEHDPTPVTGGTNNAPAPLMSLGEVNQRASSGRSRQAGPQPVATPSQQAADQQAASSQAPKATKAPKGPKLQKVRKAPKTQRQPKPPKPETTETPGSTDTPGQKGFGMDHRKMCGEVSDFLKLLAGERAFGDPHRQQAMQHLKALDGMLNVGGPPADDEKFPGIISEDDDANMEGISEDDDANMEGISGDEILSDIDGSAGNLDEDSESDDEEMRPGKVQTKHMGKRAKALTNLLRQQQAQIKRLAAVAKALVNAAR